MIVLFPYWHLVLVLPLVSALACLFDPLVTFPGLLALRSECVCFFFCLCDSIFLALVRIYRRRMSQGREYTIFFLLWLLSWLWFPTCWDYQDLITTCAAVYPFVFRFLSRKFATQDLSNRGWAICRTSRGIHNTTGTKNVSGAHTTPQSITKGASKVNMV